MSNIVVPQPVFVMEMSATEQDGEHIESKRRSEWFLTVEQVSKEHHLTLSTHRVEISQFASWRGEQAQERTSCDYSRFRINVSSGQSTTRGGQSVDVPLVAWWSQDLQDDGVSLWIKVLANFANLPSGNALRTIKEGSARKQ